MQDNAKQNKLIVGLTFIALVAISAYQASLKMPGSMCKPKAAKKK